MYVKAIIIPPISALTEIIANWGMAQFVRLIYKHHNKICCASNSRPFQTGLLSECLAIK